MTPNIQIIKHTNKLEAVAAAGEALNFLLAENKKTPVLLLLSGGSALEMLDYVGESTLGDNLTITMLDERFSLEDNANNFQQMQKTDFYTLAQDKEVNFFGTLPRPNESLADFSSRYEANLKRWKNNYPDGKIFATIGIGQDGHTAGIFPETDAHKFNQLFNSEAWAIGYDADNKQQYNLRLTTTLTFFKLINTAIGLVLGMEKKSAFNALKENQLPINLLPALGLKNINTVSIFSDIQ